MSGMNGIRGRVATIALLAVLIWYFGWIGSARLIARDEGFYLYAAQAILLGQRPYLDFFFPQMPVLPYLHAGWMALTDVSWSSARTFSGLIAALNGYLLFVYAARRFGMRIALLLVFLFCTSSMVFPWYATAQTYGVSVLFLLAAMLAVDPAKGSVSRAGAFLGGCALALAVDVRLFFAGVGPLYLLWVWWRSEPAERTRNLGLFVLGGFIGLLPALVLFLADPDAFLFNNLGYHVARSGEAFDPGLGKKWKILRVLSALATTEKFDSLQYAVLFWLGVLSAGCCLVKRRAPSLPLSLAAFLGVLSMLPTPAYVQYFAATVPFLLLVAGGMMAGMRASRLGMVGEIGVALVLLAATLPFVAKDIDRYTRTGEGVIGIGNFANAKFWNLPVTEGASATIDQVTEPGEQVILFWPGHLIGSHAVAYPGMENHFGFQAAAPLSPDERSRYHVLTRRDAFDLVRQGAARTVVVYERALWPPLRKSLGEGGYERVAAKDGLFVYQLRS